MIASFVGNRAEFKKYLALMVLFADMADGIHERNSTTSGTVTILGDKPQS